ncbi:MAG: RAMP superfamily CRISPR-associated protein [Armatimonadetes bacterium]|nr:RAMP superfamily CRISPR-associated protein [Armatimonadota bacterium]MDW8027316.1 RAMP superfamily CRISPR-associated protein [Armatimonadota bacterium]
MARQEKGEGYKETRQKSELKFSVSKLRIKNARLTGEWRCWTEVRDSVGIDRQRGAARAKAKFDYEIVPPSLEFDFWAELRDGNEREKVLLTLVLTAMEKLDLSVGAKGGSGFGTFQLQLHKVVELDLHEKQVLLRFLLKRDEFVRKSEGKSWEDWRKDILQNQSFSVRTDVSYHRIPQVFIFTYRLIVEDPLLVATQRVEPMLAFESLISRHGEDLRQREKQELDAVWIGVGKDLDMKDWKPVIPGPSVRGVFRNHCERILRTLAWHYAEGDRDKYKNHCTANVDPWQPNEQLQNQTREEWERNTRGEGTVEEKWHEAGKKVTSLVWDGSDLAERMFGSSLWKSLVNVSEVYFSEDGTQEWQDMLFDHLAVERFSGGAMEGKKFDALPITKATFEGKIAVWGDQLWMIGLVALFFKDLSEGLVRFGSGKTRGYGKLMGWLLKVEAFLLPKTQLANRLKIEVEKGKAWQHKCWQIPNDRPFPKCLQDENLSDLKELLSEGVKEMNKQVEQFIRQGA